GDDHQVLDAYPTQVGVVQAGLHGDHVAGLQPDVDVADSRKLVNLQPDTVPGAVDEARCALDIAVPLRGRSIAVLLEDIAAGQVHVASVRARFDSIQASLLRLEHRLPHAIDLGR